MGRLTVLVALSLFTTGCTGPVLDPKPTLLPPQKPELALPKPSQGPTYPPKLLKAKLGGRVVVDCTIETDGSTSNCVAVEVEGDDDFAESALNYIRTVKFLPATRNGVPVREEHFRYIIKFSPGE